MSAPARATVEAPAILAEEGLLRRLGGGLAHHVNNALTGVIASLELALRDMPPDAPALDHLLISLSAAQRAAETVRRVVAFACRTETPGRFVPLSLRQLAQEVVGRVPAPGVNVHIAGGAEGWARANPGLVGRALEAVLCNACEASPQGGTVSLWVEEQEGECRLYVRDQGPGLSAEAQRMLFEPFWTTKTGNHLGLGLALAREVVQAQGGALTVEPARDGGALAVLVLPALERSAARGVEPGHTLSAPHLSLTASQPLCSA